MYISIYRVHNIDTIGIQTRLPTNVSPDRRKSKWQFSKEAAIIDKFQRWKPLVLLSLRDYKTILFTCAHITCTILTLKNIDLI